MEKPTTKPRPIATVSDWPDSKLTARQEKQLLRIIRQMDQACERARIRASLKTRPDTRNRE